jgi:acetyl-CoA carboxylase, biotin carboxylase subunit
LLQKVLIANRGEIAVRIIRACKELEIPAVAVYSDADADALHVRMADQAVRIGPPSAIKSYLNVDAILGAAEQTKADAIHPGYGFLAENADFAAACSARGITFIGPAAEVIARMGDKAAARHLAEEADVPVVPGTAGLIDAEEARAAAEGLGYPIMVKAAAGGGGRGIRTAYRPEELRQAIQGAEREAKAAFGDGSVYLEKQLINPRHVEVQILGDHHGNVVHLYERECSMQRRRQKLIEEAPSAAITAQTRQTMTDAAVRLARAVGYTNAGTVEFLVDDARRFYFIEVNTRIQVEHPVTEMITGIDLVQEQIRIASGEPVRLQQDDIQLNGWAIEFRINAEDPENSFYPSPGRIKVLQVPQGAGIRVDSALYQGCTVQPFYDSLIGKLIVWHITREGAIQRARTALSEYHVEGIKTTIPLHCRLLDDRAFLEGTYHTGYLETVLEHQARRRNTHV